VAQEFLELEDAAAGLEEMGGEGMAEGVDAARFRDARVFLGEGEGVLAGAHGNRPAGMAALEQRDCRAIATPVITEVVEAYLREDGIAIFGTLALSDFEAELVAYDVGGREFGDFSHAQSRAVHQREQSPMLDIGGVPDDGEGLLFGQDGREPGLPFDPGNTVELPGLGQRDAEKVFEGAIVLVHRRDGALARVENPEEM
jgi:hypothetical protein